MTRTNCESREVPCGGHERGTTRRGGGGGKGLCSPPPPGKAVSEWVGGVTLQENITGDRKTDKYIDSYILRLIYRERQKDGQIYRFIHTQTNIQTWIDL